MILKGFQPVSSIYIIKNCVNLKFSYVMYLIYISTFGKKLLELVLQSRLRLVQKEGQILNILFVMIAVIIFRIKMAIMVN